MTQLKRYIRFREYFDQENSSHVVEGELGLTATAGISEALMLYSKDKKEPMRLAKDEIVRNIVAGIYGPVVKILEDELAGLEDNPANHADVMVLNRVLSKVRSL
jgi:hypothetical protein